MNIDKLGPFIKQIRNEKGLSQEQVARESGLARSYVSRLEYGNYKAPSVMTLNRLAKGLGISNERLFAEAGFPAREGGLPAFDIYCRTKLGLPEEAIEQMQAYLDLIENKYADNNKKQSSINSG